MCLAMDISLNKLNVCISTKTKTMILVLGLFVLILLVFSYFRYQDLYQENQKLEQNYKQQIHNSFERALESITSFFINRAYGNINSYGIIPALMLKDSTQLKNLSKKRFRVLSNENSYLRQMVFYDDKLNLVANIGSKKLENKKIKEFDFSDQKPKYGFFITKNQLTYNVLVPIFQEKFIGILEFVFLPEFFTEKIQSYNYGEGFIFVLEDKLKTNHNNLKEALRNNGYLLYTKENFNISDMAQKKFLQKAPLIQDKQYVSNANTFITHAFNLYSYDNEMIGKFVLYQDISEWHQKISYTLLQTLFFAVITFILLFFILNYGFDVLIKALEISNRNLKLKQSELESFNANLEIRVSEEIRKRMYKEEEARLKEQILLHQSKMASMGEMIGNIAHQWRQPLSELGAIFANISVSQEFGKLDTKKLNSKISEGENLIVHMSNTIEDFRNFFSSDKQKSVYNLNKICLDTISLIESALKNHRIKIEISAKEDIFIDGYPREFSQALLNILGNAKDVLLERNIKHPKIKLNITTQGNEAIIYIKDNGKGIVYKPIEKIFEPYISTKSGMNGTGIGLYMSKIIIERNAGGKLIVYNNDEGAVFEIRLMKVV